MAEAEAEVAAQAQAALADQVVVAPEGRQDSPVLQLRLIPVVAAVAVVAPRQVSTTREVPEARAW
jgi:hypothetical protein